MTQYEIGELDLTAQVGAAQTATNYITADSSGIKIHDTNDNSNYQHLTSDGTEIYKSGNSVAAFGDTTRVGKESDKRVEVTSNGVDIFAGTISLYGGTANSAVNKIVLNSTGVFNYYNTNNYTKQGSDGFYVYGGGSLRTKIGSGTIDLYAGAATYPKTSLTSSGVYNYYNANNYTFVKNTGMEVFVNGKSIADFGTATRIGKEYVANAADNESHMELDYHSLKLIDKEGETYFHVSDLRGSDGLLSVTQEWATNGQATVHILDYEATDTDYTVTVEDGNGNDVTSQYTITKDFVYVTLSPEPPSGYMIEAEYETASQYTKAYTAGIRRIYSHIGPMSFAEGYGNEASGDTSHAEGSGNVASSYSAHAEGRGTTASGGYAHAEGSDTTASGYISHAEGSSSQAIGHYSHAQNLGTKASSRSQTAIGKYNVEDANGDYALIVGNGTADDARSNAFVVTWDGAADLSHTLTTQKYTKAYTAAANSGSGAVNITITKAGYTPIGIVGVGSGSQSVSVVEFSLLNSTTARCYFRNVSGSAASPTCNLTVLYTAVV